MAKLLDALVLGTSGEIRGDGNSSTATNLSQRMPRAEQEDLKFSGWGCNHLRWHHGPVAQEQEAFVSRTKQCRCNHDRDYQFGADANVTFSQ